MYSSVLPLNSPPPSRTGRGPRGLGEFEGNLNDKSGKGVKSGEELCPNVGERTFEPINVTFGQIRHGASLERESRIGLSGRLRHVLKRGRSQVFLSVVANLRAPALAHLRRLLRRRQVFLQISFQGIIKIRLTAGDGVTNNSIDVDVGAIR